MVTLLVDYFLSFFLRLTQLCTVCIVVYIEEVLAYIKYIYIHYNGYSVVRGMSLMLVTLISGTGGP